MTGTDDPNDKTASGPAASASIEGFDLVSAPPDQRKEPWGLIMANADPGSGADARVEARVMMYPDKSRFFVSYPSGKEEILSPQQFVALILELKRSRRFSFERKRP
jgi:hypothetical protein